MSIEKLASRIGLGASVLLVAVLAGFWLKAVKAAPHEGPGSILIDTNGHYSYSRARYEPFGIVQAPMELVGAGHVPGSNRGIHVIRFNAVCKRDGKGGLSPVVHLTLQWYPADDRGAWWDGWVLQTTTWLYEGTDAKDLSMIALYGDIANPQDMITAAYVRPCPDLDD